MRFTPITIAALLSLTITATIVPKRGATAKRNSNVCPGIEYPRCCEANDDGVIVSCTYPGSVDSMEDFRNACEYMNKKDREKHEEGHKHEHGKEHHKHGEDKEHQEGHEHEEKRHGKKYRDGKQPMCCRLKQTKMLPDVGQLFDRKVAYNDCTDLKD
ncbi:hypothetical protein COCC4DRAFT_143069 [Bipolaris maydis ATCC 48331]|uniref:Hydrophobin n=2 Tax=Cochliobolus heterostrophus TaxID=5016 RepID=M2TMH0_COCH5|nr:uncharacterized protein COCC4DRAFT_143069 [Bipolaris maydis ATCC 48331]EMD87724.1 hypothetical protein COCHEDRAFT_1206055 [Bipolaris maydis C5]KAJ5024031.1 hypothetical protein J3E73DRAFT_425039 [Bipolaris maydis]ENI03237.1 hypothetical protein COCC4DRAFT_143069 [Bipolaris maydis ATCC 48331]KAJ5057414.1 hypothetical protein J3E74DRAFT_476445 [Bipolaris maydis]KAJ6268748.1 hypothetical protein PSV08DRAFT_404079 [Bipolaris maydis]